MNLLIISTIISSVYNSVKAVEKDFPSREKRKNEGHEDHRDGVNGDLHVSFD
jgi:hypothetical protein